MGFIWFWLVAIMIVAYVVLDGFDLGVGILQPLLAHTELDRQVMLRSIGPVWDGNEVWLIAGGGTLYFAFPLLYASAFSGFYLALMMVLWLLILRALAIELRMQVELNVWRRFFDGLFFIEPAACSLFRRRARECHSWRATGRGWLFFSSALDKLAHRIPSWNSRLVHARRQLTCFVRA
jgi:cytochrome d ubiquinol oxidase subunit II